eukprot:4857518-Amphidinium_carterae.1
MLHKALIFPDDRHVFDLSVVLANGYVAWLSQCDQPNRPSRGCPSSTSVVAHRGHVWPNLETLGDVQNSSLQDQGTDFLDVGILFWLHVVTTFSSLWVLHSIFETQRVPNPWFGQISIV